MLGYDILAISASLISLLGPGIIALRLLVTRCKLRLPVSLILPISLLLGSFFLSFSSLLVGVLSAGILHELFLGFLFAGVIGILLCLRLIKVKRLTRSSIALIVLMIFLGALYTQLNPIFIQWDALNYYISYGIVFNKFNTIPWVNTLDFSAQSPVVTPFFGPLLYGLYFFFLGEGSTLVNYAILNAYPILYVLASGSLVYYALSQVTSEKKLSDAGLVVFFSSPLILAYLGRYSFNVDSYYTFFVFSAIVWLASALSNGRRREWVLAGLSISLALFTKQIAVSLLFLIALILIVAFARRLVFGLPKPRLHVLQIGTLLLAVAPGILWLIRVWLLTGSPLGWYTLGGESATSGLLWHPPQDLTWGQGLSQIFYETRVLLRPNWQLQVFALFLDSAFGWVMIPGLVVGVAISRKNLFLAILSFSMFYLYLIWIPNLPTAQIRHLIPIIPFFAVISVVGIQRLLGDFNAYAASTLVGIQYLLAGIAMHASLQQYLWQILIGPDPSPNWNFYRSLILPQVLVAIALMVLMAHLLVKLSQADKYSRIRFRFVNRCFSFEFRTVSVFERSCGKAIAVGFMIGMVLIPFASIAQSAGGISNYHNQTSLSYHYEIEDALRYLSTKARDQYVIGYFTHGFLSLNSMYPIDLADALHLARLRPVLESQNLRSTMEFLEDNGVTYAVLPLKSRLTESYMILKYHLGPFPLVLSFDSQSYWIKVHETSGWQILQRKSVEEGIHVVAVLLGDGNTTLGGILNGLDFPSLRLPKLGNLSEPVIRILVDTSYYVDSSVTLDFSYRSGLGGVIYNSGNFSATSFGPLAAFDIHLKNMIPLERDNLVLAFSPLNIASSYLGRPVRMQITSYDENALHDFVIYIKDGLWFLDPLHSRMRPLNW